MILHLTNACLFIITWLVQLWIYPSFARMSSEQFSKRYNTYLPVIVFFTLPLMLTQAVWHSLNLYQFPGRIHIVQWIGVLITFIITFGFAVPVHFKLKKEGNTGLLIKKLLSTHTVRTIAWTVIFLLDFIKYRI